MELEYGLNKDGQMKRARFTEGQIIAVLKVDVAASVRYWLSRSEAVLIDLGFEPSLKYPTSKREALLELKGPMLATIEVWSTGDIDFCFSSDPTSRVRLEHYSFANEKELMIRLDGCLDQLRNSDVGR